MNEKKPTVSPVNLVERNGLKYKKFNDVPFTGSVKGKQKGTYKNFKKDGLWETYYENGKLKKRGAYKDGNEDDLWVSYYGNGQLLSKSTYKDGAREGLYEYYDENGKLKKKGTYKDGKLISD
jgi:antitoxin component YwqK of YwqJK toxin-antitoxin module